MKNDLSWDVKGDWKAKGGWGVRTPVAVGWP